MTANVPLPMIVEAAVEDRSKVTAQTRMLDQGELPLGWGAPGKQIGPFGKIWEDFRDYCSSSAEYVNVIREQAKAMNSSKVLNMT